MVIGFVEGICKIAGVVVHNMALHAMTEVDVAPIIILVIDVKWVSR